MRSRERHMHLDRDSGRAVAGWAQAGARGKRAGRSALAIELLYDRGRLAVTPPAGCVPTIIAKHAMPLLPDPMAAIEAALAAPVDAPPLSALARGKRSACILICDITRPVPNGLFLPAAGPHPARRRRAARGHHHPGRHRAAPAERGRGAGRAGRRPLGDRAGAGRQPPRARGRRPRPPRPDAARHGGPARPAAGRGRPQDRDRAGRAALHGRLVGRAQGDRPRRRPRRDDHDLPQRDVHGAPARGQLRAGRQPAARGAARDRAHAGRGARAQHGDRRPPPARLRQLRRDRAEPPRGGRVRAAVRRGAGAAALQDRGHQLRRLPARQDLLPDREGHGRADRHPGAGRRPDRGLRLLGGDGLARTTSRRSAGWSSWGRTASGRASRASRTPTSTSGRPRCSSSRCASAACGSTARA